MRLNNNEIKYLFDIDLESIDLGYFLIDYKYFEIKNGFLIYVSFLRYNKIEKL